MLWGNGGAVVTIETIDTGGGGGTVISADAGGAIEVMAAPHRASGAVIGSLGTLSKSGTMMAEFVPTVGMGPAVPFEWSGAILVSLDAVAALEWLAAIDDLAHLGIAYLATARSEHGLIAEWLTISREGAAGPIELGSILARQAPHPTEWIGNIASIAARDVRISVEWGSAPQLPVSVDRVQRAPGRRRVLGRHGRVRLLKGI